MSDRDDLCGYWRLHRVEICAGAVLSSRLAQKHGLYRPVARTRVVLNHRAEHAPGSQVLVTVALDLDFG